MAEYAGITFGERGTDGTRFPSHSQAMTNVLHRIPGSSRVVMQRTPDVETELATTAKTDYAGYLAFLDAVGSIGQLVLGGQYGTARLLAVSSATEVHTSGVFFVNLAFQWVSGVLTGEPGSGYGYDYWNDY